MHNEPGRQIHLDFHTSELLPDIRGGFSQTQFQEALKLGHVNLINVFAKCHHSWSYYPTKVGQPHPNLKMDLLGEQIEACHAIDVKAPIYYTVGWSAHDAETHPDWCMRTSEGEIAATGWDPAAGPSTPKPTTQWKNLCPSEGYHELIKAQTDEICRLYPVDGFWYDIYQAHVLCYCDRCLRGMSQESMDPKDEQQVERYRALTIQRHCEDLTRVILAHHPDASLFFNGMTTLNRPQNLRHRLYQWNTKNDLEDLPTTWGGYDKFPLRAKRFLKEGKPIVAMSGKFHTSWGEFGGFKDREALRYEAASMIAFGSRCNFGDQLHPHGMMNLATYRNIGHAYDYVRQIESLGIGGLPAASLGLWMGNDLSADEGLARMLLEEQIDFEMVGAGDDLSRYQTVVVPSVKGVLDPAQADLEVYVSSGGTLMILGDGVLDGSCGVIPFAGVDYDGPPRYDVDYTEVSPDRGWDLPDSPFLNYQAAIRLRPAPGTEVLAGLREPYFSRTYGAYCGHRNTPYRLEKADHPAATRKGGIIVCAHALDRIYYDLGARVHRILFAGLLRLLHNRPLVEADLPSAGRVSLLHFGEERRYVLHLLYAPPLERGQCVVIEDQPVLRNVRLSLRLPQGITGLRLEPAGLELEGKEIDGTITTVVPEFSCHCAVVARY